MHQRCSSSRSFPHGKKSMWPCIKKFRFKFRTCVPVCVRSSAWENMCGSERREEDDIAVELLIAKLLYPFRVRSKANIWDFSRFSRFFFPAAVSRGRWEISYILPVFSASKSGLCIRTSWRGFFYSKHMSGIKVGNEDFSFLKKISEFGCEEVKEPQRSGSFLETNFGVETRPTEAKKRLRSLPFPKFFFSFLFLFFSFGKWWARDCTIRVESPLPFLDQIGHFFLFLLPTLQKHSFSRIETRLLALSPTSMPLSI